MGFIIAQMRHSFRIFYFGTAPLTLCTMFIQLPLCKQIPDVLLTIRTEKCPQVPSRLAVAPPHSGIHPCSLISFQATVLATTDNRLAGFPTQSPLISRAWPYLGYGQNRCKQLETFLLPAPKPHSDRGGSSSKLALVLYTSEHERQNCT